MTFQVESVTRQPVSRICGFELVNLLGICDAFWGRSRECDGDVRDDWIHFYPLDGLSENCSIRVIGQFLSSLCYLPVPTISTIAPITV